MRRRGWVVPVIITGCLALALVGAVSLAVSAVGGPDPGDTKENATEISPDATVSDDIPGGDDDWYAFRVQRGETINVTATMEADGSNDVTLVGPGGTSASARGSGETVSTGMTARQTGTYYVHVRRSSKPGATYTLTVRTYSTSEREPNERGANATGISVGSTVSDTISIGDADWYAFRVQRGMTINLTATMGPGGSNDVTLVGPGGTSASARGSGETVLTGMTARQSGTYYVEVRANAFPGADYSFGVRTYSTSEREPNERRANATRLSLNATVEDTVSIGDTDWYAFDLQRGDSINISGRVGSEGSNDVTVIGPEDERLNSSRASGRNLSLSATARNSGTHYLNVRQSSFPGANYTLDVRTNGTGTIQEATPADDEVRTTTTPATSPEPNPDTNTETSPETASDSGLPIPPIVVVVVIILIVLLLLVLLWRRDDEDEEDEEYSPGRQGR